MSLLLDGAVLLIILIFALVGWRRGAAITLLNFVAWIAAFTAAVLLSPVLANAIYSTFFQSGVTEQISQTIGSSLNDGAEAIITNILTVVPQFAALFLNSISFNTETVSGLIENGSQDTVNSAATAVEALVSPAFTSLIGLILMVVLFFVLLAVFKFFARLLSKCFEIPVLSFVNRLFGGILGIGEGVLLIMLIAALVRIAIPLSGDSLPFFSQEVINNSLIFKAFYTGEIINNIAGMFA